MSSRVDRGCTLGFGLMTTLLAGLLLVGCGEEPGTPAATVSPSQLSFSQWELDKPVYGDLVVRNSGSGSLEVRSARIQAASNDDNEFVLHRQVGEIEVGDDGERRGLVRPPDSFPLEAGRELHLVVEYRPADFNYNDTGKVLIIVDAGEDHARYALEVALAAALVCPSTTTRAAYVEFPEESLALPLPLTRGMNIAQIRVGPDFPPASSQRENWNRLSLGETLVREDSNEFLSQGGAEVAAPCPWADTIPQLDICGEENMAVANTESSFVVGKSFTEGDIEQSGDFEPLDSWPELIRNLVAGTTNTFLDAHYHFNEAADIIGAWNEDHPEDPVDECMLGCKQVFNCGPSQPFGNFYYIIAHYVHQDSQTLVAHYYGVDE